MRRGKQKTLIWAKIQHKNLQENYFYTAKMAPQKVDKLITFEVAKLITLERPKGGQTNNFRGGQTNNTRKAKRWTN